MKIEKGSQEWWIWLATWRVATEYLRRTGAPCVKPVITLQAINRFLLSIRRNPFKRLWYVMTVGEADDRIVEALGTDVTIIDVDGDETSRMTRRKG